jgi:hypothetical protein
MQHVATGKQIFFSVLYLKKTSNCHVQYKNEDASRELRPLQARKKLLVPVCLIGRFVMRRFHTGPQHLIDGPLPMAGPRCPVYYSPPRINRLKIDQFLRKSEKLVRTSFIGF